MYNADMSESMGFVDGGAASDHAVISNAIGIHCPSIIDEACTLIKRQFGLNPIEAAVVERFDGADWRDVRIEAKTGQSDIIAIKHRNGEWVLLSNDPVFNSQLPYRGADGNLRSGFLVAPSGAVERRIFTRAGRMLLNTGESETVDLGPCDPDL